MTLYLEEGFAGGQNGGAELTQEPRTSVLIQQREDGSTYEKDLRVVAHEDQWRAASSVEAEEALAKPWQIRRASTEEPLGKETRISAYRRKSPTRNSFNYTKELDGTTNSSPEIPRLTLRADEIQLEHKETQEQLAWPKRGSHKTEAPSYEEQDGTRNMKLRELKFNTEGQRKLESPKVDEDDRS
ncbi:hypothetical protein BC827DRAFT_1152846 [Russula dissimulans]|nr:hypothetical protein BC827DRAFT_1152846 [Russula dissimulans]